MLFSDSSHGAATLYERLLPSLNPDSQSAGDVDWRTPCRGARWIDTKCGTVDVAVVMATCLE